MLPVGSISNHEHYNCSSLVLTMSNMNVVVAQFCSREALPRTYTYILHGIMYNLVEKTSC